MYISGFYVYISDAVKIFNWLKSKGIDHYNTTVIEEYNMGSYALLVGSYTAYDKHDMVTDKGNVCIVLFIYDHIYIYIAADYSVIISLTETHI